MFKHLVIVKILSQQQSVADSVLLITVVPKVHVSPSTQFHTSGSSVTLKCHADGVPEPNIMWEMNESPLAYDPEESHYYLKRKPQ